ncbi:MAG TPA: DUF4396 domain-containing protein [Minicystis sp.]|nr:DUF4396 domain-containing protein [Minicystis sp.]
MLSAVAWVYIAICIACALAIAVDLARGHRQHMWNMDVVWPVTALWAGPIALCGYFVYGRAGEERAFRRAEAAGEKPPNVRQPFSILAAKGTTHCGSACTLADVVTSIVLAAAPLSLFGHEMFGDWLVDLGAAFLLGIAFQYFTIQPMRQLSPKEGLKQAAKADTLSLLAWQVGMYGWMAIAAFAIFHHELSKSRPVFWWMMQIAMFFGFATAYPVNRFLLHRGIKEKM